MTERGPRPPGPLDPTERARWRIRTAACPPRRFLVTLYRRGYRCGSKVVGVTACNPEDARLIAASDVPEYPDVQNAVEVEPRC